MSNTSPPDNPSPHHPVSLAASDLVRITHDHNSDTDEPPPLLSEPEIEDDDGEDQLSSCPIARLFAAIPTGWALAPIVGVGPGVNWEVGANQAQGTCNTTTAPPLPPPDSLVISYDVGCQYRRSSGSGVESLSECQCFCAHRHCSGIDKASDEASEADDEAEDGEKDQDPE